MWLIVPIDFGSKLKTIFGYNSSVQYCFRAIIFP